jgi:Carboxypeptidase regulatory-like domain
MGDAEFAEDTMRGLRRIGAKGLLALVCSVLVTFQPVFGAQETSGVDGGKSGGQAMMFMASLVPGEVASGAPELIAVAKLTGTAERNDQPLLNGSVIASGDSLRTHGDSALLLASAPGERLWIGPNTTVKMSKDAGSVRVALARGTLAFQSKGRIQVTIDNHEGLALRSRPDTSVLAQLSLVNDQEVQVRVQEGSLELVEGDRAVLLQPEKPSQILATGTRAPAEPVTKRPMGDQDAASSQSNTGSINGTVVDSQLFVVSDASVTLTNSAGQTLTAVTKDGKFIFKDVPAGNYTLRVAKTRFHTYELKDVVVRSGNESSLFVHLAGGAKSNNSLLIWIVVGGAAAAGIGAYAATRGSSSSSNSPSTTQ